MSEGIGAEDVLEMSKGNWGTNSDSNTDAQNFD